MTNGVVRSDALEIHTLTMRLQYAGTVDLQENVNAHVTAQLMRNTPVVGSLVSLILYPVSKIFECQVNGRISDPKVTPIYFPFSKYLLMPLHPGPQHRGNFSSASGGKTGGIKSFFSGKNFFARQLVLFAGHLAGRIAVKQRVQHGFLRGGNRRSLELAGCVRFNWFLLEPGA